MGAFGLLSSCGRPASSRIALLILALALPGCAKVPRFEHAEVQQAWRARDFDAPELQPFTRGGVVISARLVQGRPFVLLDFISPVPATVHIHRLELVGLEDEGARTELEPKLSVELTPKSEELYRHTEHLDFDVTPDAFDAIGQTGYRLRLTWQVGDAGTPGTTEIDLARTEIWAWVI